MNGKTVSSSAVSNRIIEIDSDDLNSDGILLEGRIMQIVNAVAADVACQHAECPCIALGINSVRFFHPARFGDLLICKGSVNRTWANTLEVGIKVVAEDFRTLDVKNIFSAYFTFNATDEDVEIAPVIPETPEQLQRFHDAESRRQLHHMNIDKMFA